jgi:hypothetical protein
LVRDDARGLGRAFEGAVDDARQTCVAQAFADRGGLGAAERAQPEAGDMAVQDAIRVFDVRVTNQIDAVCQCP